MRRDPNESELRRTAKACSAILLPLLGLYCMVIGMDKGVGFAPAYAQEGTTTRPQTTGRPTTTAEEEPTTTEEPPVTGTFPEEPTTTEGEPTTTEEPGPPSTTYMIPGLTTVPRAGGGGGGPGPTTGDCRTPPGVTEVTWKCNGATWICHNKQSTPGTYCIDP